MSKVTIECQVLEYDELDEKLKERLLTEEWECLAEIYRADHIVDSFKEKLEAIGFTDVEFSYDYSNSQCDGAVFDGHIDIEKICKHLGVEYDDNYEGRFDIESTSRGMGVHNSTRVVVYAPPDRETNKRRKQSEELHRAIEKLRLQLCDEFFDALKEDFDTETGKENLLTNLRSRKFVMRQELETAIAEASSSENIQII